MNANPPLTRILRLAPRLANQIAAGEVIERPASVVKELVENSLDAGASCIEIDIEQAGRRLIRVRDDGCGIHRDDLRLALDRHATSKLRDPADLGRITSLGFRGEALPSIGSVSRLSLYSRSLDSSNGWSLICQDAASPAPLAPVAHPLGTTVDVRDLFYNVPARRKFLRTDRTEFGHIQDMIGRLALSCMEVAVNLRHNGRSVYHLRRVTDPESHAARIAAVCGKAFLDSAVSFGFEAQDLCLRGWIAGPTFTRSQSGLQYFYVNGRVVRDKLVNHAVRQACESQGFQGRHPAYVLYLNTDPAGVDVNVHPTKHEVRFRDARQVHDFIVQVLRRALSGSPGEATAAHGAASGSPAAATVAEAPSTYTVARPASATGAGVARQSVPPGVVRATLLDRYLLVERGAGPLLVDVRAVWAAVWHERLTALLDEGAVPMMPLLVPLLLEPGEAEAEKVLNRSDVLLRHGLDIGCMSPGTLVVRQVPTLFGNVDCTALMQDLLAGIGDPDGEETLAQRITRLAARHVRNPLGADAVNELLHNLERIPVHETDTGRPLWIPLDVLTIEKLFSST